MSESEKTLLVEENETLQLMVIALQNEVSELRKQVAELEQLVAVAAG